MALTISHRNQNSTGPRADVASSLIVGGMVRIEAQRGLDMQQEGLFALCRKILGFIAATCQVSYRSNPKTTCRSRSARLLAKAGIQGTAPRGAHPSLRLSPTPPP